MPVPRIIRKTVRSGKVRRLVADSTYDELVERFGQRRVNLEAERLSRGLCVDEALRRLRRKLEAED